MRYTSGPWAYNRNNSKIESQTDYLVLPEDGEPGVPTQVIDCFGAMSENADGDIRLICKAPEMAEILTRIRYALDPSVGGIDRRLTEEELQQIIDLVNELP